MINLRKYFNLIKLIRIYKMVYKLFYTKLASTSFFKPCEKSLERQIIHWILNKWFSQIESFDQNFFLPSPYTLL
jgi:hypothetical protein